MALVLLDRQVRPHVSIITLNKPERLNSMSFPLVEALYEALDEVGRDNDTWVVVMTGADRAFCAGLDLHDRGIPPNTQDLGFSRLAMRSMSYMSDVIPAMRLGSWTSATRSSTMISGSWSPSLTRSLSSAQTALRLVMPSRRRLVTATPRRPRVR